MIETKLIRQFSFGHKSDALASFIAFSCHLSFRTVHGQRVSLHNIVTHLVRLALQCREARAHGSVYASLITHFDVCKQRPVKKTR